MKCTKENVLEKLAETMQDYSGKFAKTNKADEKVAYALAESVIKSLIIDFQNEFE